MSLRALLPNRERGCALVAGAEAELLGRHIVAVRGRKRTPAPSSTQAERHDDTDEGVSFWYVLDPAQHLGLAPSVGASDSETAA